MQHEPQDCIARCLPSSAISVCAVATLGLRFAPSRNASTMPVRAIMEIICRPLIPRDRTGPLHALGRRLTGHTRTRSPRASFASGALQVAAVGLPARLDPGHTSTMVESSLGCQSASARGRDVRVRPGKGEGGDRPVSALLRSPEAARASLARPQSQQFSRTSLRMEVMRLMRVSRPLVAQRLRPPTSKFS